MRKIRIDSGKKVTRCLVLLIIITNSSIYAKIGIILIPVFFMVLVLSVSHTDVVISLVSLKKIKKKRYINIRKYPIGSKKQFA